MIKLKIQVNTFFKKGIKTIKDDFSIYLITGYQGSGKTYFAVKEVYEKFRDRTIITNIKTLMIPNADIHYFTRLNQIYSYNDDKCVFIIDELSKAFPKESKQDKAFYSWLQQSRKHKRYVYLITQEYLQVPTWLRGVANQVYTTKKLFFNIFITSLGFPVLDDESKEWETDNFLYIIYKRNKLVANLYDTFELVNEL